MEDDLIVDGKPDYWDEAVEYLVKKDRILKKIIDRNVGISLFKKSSPFLALVRAIMGQQVSTASAKKSWEKFTQLCGSRPSYATVLKYSVEQLREVGIAKRKAEYIVDLATHFAEKKVNPSKWSKMQDEAIIAELCAIRGIGLWTAEMFLIFHLHRPNVLPLDDPNLKAAIAQHYFSGEPVSRFEARELALAWQPWRTVATWYLWRSLNG